MKTVTFEGWKNCVELKSGDFRIIVTTEVGPRVIAGYYKKSANLFLVDPKLAGKTGGTKWVNYGGHRFWHAPEDPVRTYEPDNSAVQVVELDDGVSFLCKTDKRSGLTRTLNIYPDEPDTFVVEHVLRNDGPWPVEAAAWGISVMAPGGTALIPQNAGDPKGLLPTNFLSIWPYTDMSDERIVWDRNFVGITQIPGRNPMKLGFHCNQGWSLYLNDGIAFGKQFEFMEDEIYPDNGCTVEVYACDTMLELETLSPLSLIEPGEEIVHVENWFACLASALEDSLSEEPCCCEDHDADADDCGCGCSHPAPVKTKKKKS